MSVEAKVKSIIKEELTIQDEPVNEDNLVDDLKMDSLDGVELIMALEEEFGIQVPDEDAERITTVKELVEYVQQKVDERGE